MGCIEIIGLEKSFGHNIALSSLSLSFTQGEISCVLGPNGAGKTTLFNIIAGDLERDSGSIEIFGKAIERYAKTELRKKIVLLPQTFWLYDRLKVSELITLFERYLHPDRQRLNMLVSEFDMKAIVHTQLRYLSEGQRRKVGVLVTLMNQDAELFLLDEPTVGLDPVSRRAVWKVLNEMNDAGKTIVFSTHYIEEAERFSDIVALLNEGNVVRHGKPSRLISDEFGLKIVILTIGEPPPSMSIRKDMEQAGCDFFDGKMEVCLKDEGETLAKVFSLIGQGCVTVKDVSVRRHTLEDVFFKVTGRVVEEDDPSVPFRA